MSKEELAKITSDYDDLQMFRTERNSTYQLICRKGLLKELCSHMKRKHRKGLSDEALAEIALGYDDLSEFQEKDRVTYSIICSRGLRKKLCAHMKRHVAESLSDEELAEIASHYTVAREFREKETSAYHAIVDRGLTDKLLGHMQYEVRQDVPDEELAKIVSGYSVMKEFREKEQATYVMICKRGLIDKLCRHMQRGCRVLTDNLLAEIAQGYHSRKEFAEQDPGAYTTACKRGIIDNICAHMEKMVSSGGFWTKELCHASALNYFTKTEFKQGDNKAYDAALRHGWLDEACSHMVPKGNRFKRKIYAFTFSDGYAYVGLTQDPKVRYRQHTTPQKKLSPVYKHIQNTGAVFDFQILTDWLHKDVAGKVEDDYIKQYTADGWKMLNTNKGGSLGGSTNLYPHERIVQEVAKYEYVDDFMKGSPGFYHYIHNHNLMDVYCANLKYKTKPAGYWTLERAIAVTSECKSRKELQKKYGQAYSVLNNAGVLDDYYPNNLKKVTWTMEKSLSVVPLCKSRKELRRKFQRAYNVLLSAGVLDKYFPREWRPFSLEDRMEIIKGCNTRMELRRKHRTVYNWAKKNGLIDVYLPKKR